MSTTPRLRTDYDVEHIVAYLRMLDANAHGADWCDVARLVLRAIQIAIAIGRIRCSTAICYVQSG